MGLIALFLCSTLLQSEHAGAQNSLVENQWLRGEVLEATALLSSPVLETHYSGPPVRAATFTARVPSGLDALTIESHSHMFDGYLVVRGAGGNVIAEDDDAGGNWHPRVTIQEPPSGEIEISVGALHGRLGQFRVRWTGARRSPTKEEVIAFECKDLVERRAVLRRIGIVRDARFERTLIRLAGVYRTLGQNQEALRVLEELDIVQVSLRGRESLAWLGTRRAIAQVAYQAGYQARATELLREVVVLAEELGAAGMALALNARIDLATVSISSADLATARRVLGEAMRIAAKLPARHPTLLQIRRLSAVAEPSLAESERQLSELHGMLDDSVPASAVASIRRDLGRVRLSQGMVRSALSILDSALCIAPVGSELRISVLEVRADAYLQLGKPASAIGSIEEVVRYWQKRSVPSSRQLVDAKTIRSAAMLRMGRAVEAREAMRNLLRSCPESGVIRANVLASLACAEAELGEHEEALRLGREALEIARALEAMRLVASVERQMAISMAALRRYQDALSACKRSVELQLDLLGELHFDYARTLVVIASVFRERYDYGSALAVLKHAVPVLVRSLGEEHIESMAARSLRAQCFVYLGRDADARREIARVEPNLGALTESNSSLAWICLARFADVSGALGGYEKAISTCQRLLVGGGDHEGRSLLVSAVRGQLLASLCRVHRYEEAADVLEKLLSDDAIDESGAAPLRILIRDAEARIRAWSGDLEKARAAAAAAVEDGLSIVEMDMRLLPELDRIWRVFSTVKSMGLLLASLGPNPAEEDVRSAHALHSRVKGMVARRVARERRLIHLDKRPSVLRSLREHADVTAQLMAIANRTGMNSKVTVGDVVQLGTMKHQLERNLLGLVGASSRHQETGEMFVGAGEVLLDYVVFRDVLDKTDRVGVFVVSADGIVFKELAVASRVSRFVRFFRQAASGGQESLLIEASNQLFETIWRPIRDCVPSGASILVCPDRFLATVPFEALLDPATGGYVIEEHEIRYVMHLADSYPKRMSSGKKQVGLFVGGVDYGERQESRGRWFRSLPSAKVEARKISDLASEEGRGFDEVKLLCGNAAGEVAFREAVAGCTVIHVATHGIYDAFRKLSPSSNDPGAVDPARSAQRLAGMLPGTRSGLALAGANLPGGDGSNDGILTAEEIGWLDLSSCDLFVLSGCETGLGAPASGEQLLGLRRAIRIAGARSVVSTLWKVGDKPTADFMERFYRNLWERGMDKSQALRAAQLQTLAESRKRDGRSRPHTWGAFVLNGSRD